MVTPYGFKSRFSHHERLASASLFCCLEHFQIAAFFENDQKELILDYEKRDYGSMKEDFRIVLKREWRYLLFIVVINILTFSLTNLEIMMLGKPTVTGVFALYTPMRILAIAFPFSEIFGLAVATLYACALYLLLVLWYRKKRYAVLEHEFRLAKYRGNTNKE